MKSMQNSVKSTNFSAHDLKALAKLIQTAAKSGATSMRMGEFEISFNGSVTVGNPGPAKIHLSQEEIEKLEKTDLFDKERELRDTQIEELPLTDPVAFMDLLEQGALKQKNVRSQEESHV